MGIDAVSNVNANFTTAISRIQFGCTYLSDETIKKLKELGIDPATVKNESEAKSVIAQAEKAKSSKNAQQNLQIQQPQFQSPNVDMNQLHFDIKEMGKLLGIDTTLIKDLKEIVDKFDVTVKEFVHSASVQANRAVGPKFNNVQKGVKISTGVEVVAKPEDVQADFKSIKDRVEKIENAKNSMFSGQEMLGVLNRIALCI